MKKAFPILVMLFVVAISSNVAYCQTKQAEPVIISVVPDSLFAQYDYSQTAFFTVSISTRLLKESNYCSLQVE